MKKKFQNLVLLYGELNIYNQVTYDSFAKWFYKNGYNLNMNDNYWKGVFRSILLKNFVVHLEYCITKEGKLCTIFKLKKNLIRRVNKDFG